MANADPPVMMPQQQMLPAIHPMQEAVAVQGQRINNFSQLYNDERQDPCRRNYESVMRRFDASVPGAIASDLLFDQVVGVGGSTPQAYLFCTSTVAEPRIYCAHSPSKYVEAVDGTASRWDGQSFAFIGDVVMGMTSSIGFPRNAFEEVQLWCKTVENMLNNLNILDLQPVFPPSLPDLDDPDTSHIVTRRMIYLPAVYVPLLLNSSGYTLRQVWDILYPAILQRQETVICAPLIRWLQAASTGSVVNNPLTVGPPLVHVPMQAPPADEQLLRQRHKVLYQLLPALSAPPQTLETALTHMAAALIAQTNDARMARELKSTQDAEPKLPSDRFKVTLPVLLEYLEIQNEADLPQVWHAWANCTKKQEIQILRDALDAFTRTADAFSTSVPVVTARLVQDLLAFNFVGTSSEDIQGGFHPFIITDGNAENRHSNLETARLYGLLTAGDATISLADLEALSAKEIRSVPVSYWELEKSLGMFGNLLGVILGPQHALTKAYRDMWVLLQTNVRDDIHAIIEYKGGNIKPVHLLRSIQLIFYTWFTHKRSRLAPPDPNMKLILHQLLMQVYLTPKLPPPLYKLAFPHKASPSFGSDASLPGTVTTGSLTSGSSSAASGTRSASDASTVSGLTAPTIPPPTRGSVVINLKPNSALQTLLPANIKLKELIGNTSPPQLDSGGEMCLSFLTRNTCWSNCKRAAQHTANLNPNEFQRLEQYITQQKSMYAAKRTRASSTATSSNG
jgi:hypothetical protein